MDPLAFIAALVKALAWPATVVILLFVLRKELRRLLPLLTRFKYKEFELEFGRKVEQLETKVTVELPERTMPQPLPGPSDRILRLAEVSPRAAVLEAWNELEAAAIERARRAVVASGGDPTKVRTGDVIRQLQNDPTLTSAATDALPVLRELRNRAAHAPEFALGSASVIRYATLTSRIVRELEGKRGV